MKKLVLILIIGVLGITSCENETSIKPQNTSTSSQGNTVKAVNDGAGG